MQKPKIYLFLQFDSEKMDDGEVAISFGKKLEKEIDNIQEALIRIFRIFNVSYNTYAVSMRRSIEDTVPYLEKTSLNTLHLEHRLEAMEQVRNKIKENSFYL